MKNLSTVFISILFDAHFSESLPEVKFVSIYLQTLRRKGWLLQYLNASCKKFNSWNDKTIFIWSKFIWTDSFLKPIKAYHLDEK